MTERSDWLKAHYDNTCATRARGDNLAGIATALGGLIEQRHAQGEAFMDFKIALLQEEVARARIQIVPAELREDFMHSIGLPEITPEMQHAMDRVSDLYHGADPETPEEAEIASGFDEADRIVAPELSHRTHKLKKIRSTQPSRDKNSTGLQQGASILSDVPDVAAEQPTSPARRLTHIMDLVYGRVAPQTDEERQIVEDDKQWKRQHTTWPKVRRNPGPVDFDESRFRG